MHTVCYPNPATPPSSVRRCNPDHDSGDKLRLQSARTLVQTPPSSPPEQPQNYHGRNDWRHPSHTMMGPPRISVGSKRRRMPSSEEIPPNSENDIFAFPRLPPIMERLPSLVGHAHKRFRPFEQPHGLMPNALELRFSQRCLDSGETDISLSDIQEVCQPKAHHHFINNKCSISGKRRPSALPKSVA